jgi:hypothetical protein
MMSILQLYRTPDGVWAFDDANNAVVFLDQPCIAPLFTWGTETVDIPPSQLMLDVAIYEVDTRNDLILGVDWQALKNGPNNQLFNFLAWDFNGDSELGLFPGSPAIADRGRIRSYDAVLTTAYLDLLQSKGRARLLTQTVVSAKSGTVAELAAVDDVASFASQTNTDGSSEARPLPLQLADVYDYYWRTGAVGPSLDEILNQPIEQALAALRNFLTITLALPIASVDAVMNDLAEKAEDGNLSRGDAAAIYVSPDVQLRVFQDRSMNYLKTGRVGVFMSILPVVGLE